MAKCSVCGREYLVVGCDTIDLNGNHYCEICTRIKFKVKSKQGKSKS